MTEEVSTYKGLKIVYSINSARKIKYVQKNELDHLLTPHTRINSKLIKDVTIRPQTIKILEENIGSKISDIAHRNFL